MQTLPPKARSVGHLKRCAVLPRVLLTGAIAWVLAAGGCEQADPHDARPIDVRVQFGGVGHADGEIVYPRAIDNDGESLWIIDKSARVHQFSFDGEFLGGWIMPAYDRGKPVGVTCGPDGNVYIADTHEYRIAVFSPDGELLDAWGTYGEEPGQFRYVTDVAIIPDEHGEPDRFYVTEYGGNDRVTVFDRDHEVLFTFGRFGAAEESDGIAFMRPQSIIYEPERNELIVADAGNHRLGRFTPEGELIGWVGREDGLPSRDPGGFGYPYGLALVGDGTLLVSEFGTNRVQHIDPVTGEGLAIYGVGGRGEGELAYPWGVTIADGRPWVLDSGNHRVYGFRLAGGGMLGW